MISTRDNHRKNNSYQKKQKQVTLTVIKIKMNLTSAMKKEQMKAQIKIILTFNQENDQINQQQV